LFDNFRISCVDEVSMRAIISDQTAGLLAGVQQPLRRLTRVLEASHCDAGSKVHQGLSPYLYPTFLVDVPCGGQTWSRNIKSLCALLPTGSPRSGRGISTIENNLSVRGNDPPTYQHSGIGKNPGHSVQSRQGIAMASEEG